MRLDVESLQNFYSISGLGLVVKDVITSVINEHWDNIQNKNIVGFGFLSPVAELFQEEREKLTLLMPASQGAIRWPNDSANVCVLSEEYLWPLPTGMTDYMIFLHGVEFSENISALLNECRRILAPGGKALFIVPNRTGLWCRGEATPFGSGRPYTVTQLKNQLLANSFHIGSSKSVLFSIPSNRKFSLKSAKFMESFGRKVLPGQFGGVLVVEASKQIAATTRASNKIKMRVSLRTLDRRPITSKTCPSLNKKV